MAGTGVQSSFRLAGFQQRGAGGARELGGPPEGSGGRGQTLQTSRESGLFQTQAPDHKEDVGGGSRSSHRGEGASGLEVGKEMLGASVDPKSGSERNESEKTAAQGHAGVCTGLRVGRDGENGKV